MRGGFKELSVRGVLEPALSERLTAWVASQVTACPGRTHRVMPPSASVPWRSAGTSIGSCAARDRCTRPEIPFEPIVPAERGIESSALAAASARLPRPPR